MKSPSSVQTCTSQGTFGWVVGYMVDERVVVSSRYDNESETKKQNLVSSQRKSTSFSAMAEAWPTMRRKKRSMLDFKALTSC